MAERKFQNKDIVPCTLQPPGTRVKSVINVILDPATQGIGKFTRLKEHICQTESINDMIPGTQTFVVPMQVVNKWKLSTVQFQNQNWLPTHLPWRRSWCQVRDQIALRLGTVAHARPIFNRLGHSWHPAASLFQSRAAKKQTYEQTSAVLHNNNTRLVYSFILCICTGRESSTRPNLDVSIALPAMMRPFLVNFNMDNYYQTRVQNVRRHMSFTKHLAANDIIPNVCSLIGHCLQFFLFWQINRINQNIEVSATGTGEATLKVSRVLSHFWLQGSVSQWKKYTFNH